MKNKKIIITLSMIFILLTMGIGGHSYAKYISQVKGNGTMTVAKWSFKANETTQQFETIKLMQTVNEETLTAGKVAPGTSGRFTIKIDGTGSEVGIRYTVNFINEKNKPTNVKFKYNGTEYKSLSELNDIIKGDISVSKNQIRLIYIDWSWPYETGTGTVMTNADKTDTQEGLNPLDYTFDIVVKGTQIRI